MRRCLAQLSTKLYIIQFSPPSCSFLPLRPNSSSVLQYHSSAQYCNHSSISRKAEGSNILQYSTAGTEAASWQHSGSLRTGTDPVREKLLHCLFTTLYFCCLLTGHGGQTASCVTGYKLRLSLVHSGATGVSGVLK
jgi:hypothetical protein